MRKMLKILIFLFITLPVALAFAQQPVYDASSALGSYLGTHIRERVGYWLNPAGDVNGDGFDDFLIANYHTQTNGYDAGATYLILGKPNESWSKNVSLGQADARFLGDTNYSALGYHVDGGGDVNGDGLSDFILGSPAGNEDGKDRPGTAYIIFGRHTANWGYNFVPEYSADAFYEGEVDFDQLGKSVAIVGDLNGDGFDDVVLGAPYSDAFETNGGKVYVILGKATGWVAGGKILQHANASFRSELEEDLAGYMVSGAGDVNGDGYDDFLIGAPGKGNAYLIFGRPNANWGYNFNLGNADVIFSRENRSDNLGWIVAEAGDVNHDSFDDFLVTTPYNGENGTESGKTYLILGHGGEWPQAYDLDYVDASFLGEHAYDNSGWSASGVGDINGDGFDDFMIGAWYNDQAGQNAGKAYIIYGKVNGWQQNQNLSTIGDYILGENAIDYMGFSVSAAGDVNQDGLADFIVSAPYCNQAFEWGGKIHVFPGERPKFPIDGHVSYHDNAAPVPGVAVKFYGSAEDSVFTDAQGDYSWVIPDGRNVNVWLRKSRSTDQDFMTILSYDAALTARAAVGLETLSPYQQVAADADGDQNITTFDASLIAQYVVDPKELPSSRVNQWRFDPASRIYGKVSEALEDQNYVAVIVGNVHGGWTAPSKMSKQTVLPETAKPVSEIENNLLNVAVQIPAGTDLLALDLQLGYDPQKVQFRSIQKNAAIQSFNLFYREKDGKLTVSLFGVKAVQTDSPVCTIQFKILAEKEEIPEINFTRFVVNTQAYQPIRTGIDNPAESIPESFVLGQNYPNPFNPATTIDYQLPRQARVQISIYNLMGQEICKLVNAVRAAGNYQVQWDGKDAAGKDVAAGIYLYKAILENEVKIKRMVKLM